MKRISVIIITLVLLTLLSALAVSGAEQKDISQFEFPTPQAPSYFIYTDGDASEARHDDLRMIMITDPEVALLAAEYDRDSEAFYEKYGLWSFEIVMQYDVSLDGEDNWQHTEAWDTEYWNGGYAEGYGYNSIRSELMEDFEYFWLTYHEGQGSDTFIPLQPAIITEKYYYSDGYEEDIYSFDTENHSLYIRCRYYMEWEPLVEYEEGMGPGEKQSKFSQWSESAVFGKNSTQIIPEEPTVYEAPIISDIKIVPPDEGEEYAHIEYNQTTPQSVWMANVYYVMTGEGYFYGLETQVSINGGEWVEFSTADSGDDWCLWNGSRSAVSWDHPIEENTNVKLRVRFNGTHGPSPWSNILEANAGEFSFTDVKPHHWFAEAVGYCVEMGYVQGMTPTTFEPNGNLTRAQFITILAKVDGADLVPYEEAVSGFKDVKASHWYNKYVCWAADTKVTSGLSPTKFGPNDPVTRAQLARFFYAYSELRGISTEGRADITAYPDVKKVADWAREGIEWAVDAKLISGVKRGDVDFLDPNGTATRAQAAVMFRAFDEYRAQGSKE